MIKLPQNNQWTQLNDSYKTGSLWATKNVNLDEAGVIKLSPRMVNIFDDSEDVANIADTDFNFPVAFGRSDSSTFLMATTDEPFDISLSETAKTIAEDTDSDNPNMTFDSHGVWWQNRWYASTSTTVSYKSGGTWTAGVITGLTSGVRHYMTVFKNKKVLAVSDGNLVKLYDTSHSNTITLTLPSDYEVIGLAYNNYKLGIITRLGDDTEGQNSNAFLFVWDGASSEAGTGVDVGAYANISIHPYKSSFIVVTTEGQILYFNGGGFDELAHFPFYSTGRRISDFLNFQSYGDNIVVDGDIIYINIGFDFDDYGKLGEEYLDNNPAGIWCYDPKVGLYHRYSFSNSRAYRHALVEANVNTTTDIITTSAPIPATGSPLILAYSGAIGGLERNQLYYVIKLSSTTFAVAKSYEHAISLVKIDLTSASSNMYIWMYDVLDYGVSYEVKAGAITKMVTTDISTQLIGGVRMRDTDDTNIVVLNTAVPFIPNVGYLVTSKLFLNSQTENIQSIVIKHRTLGVDDKIIVKVKVKDYKFLPHSTPNNSSSNANWTSTDEFYTTSNLSDVKTAFDSGEELEIEFLTGAGAGQMSKIESIEESGGTYTVTTVDDIVGASSGLKSNFKIDNWKVYEEIDYENQTEGVKEIQIKANGKAPQFKIELRGIGTAIEDIIINNTPQIA